MKPVAFDYVSAGSLDEALFALQRGGDDARVLAGGQSLVPMLNFRVVRPSVLVDLNGVGDLAHVRLSEAEVLVGAMARQATILASSDIASACPLLSLALAHVGHPQTRARGTIGGSLCHADPAAELPVAAVLLDARMRAKGPSGEREIPARDFFSGPLSTALAAGEILTGIVFPRARPGDGFGFAETSLRKGDFALASAAARISADLAEIAIGGVGDTPFLTRLVAADARNPGRREEAIRSALAPLQVTQHSHHGSADYRRKLSAIMALRAVEAAVNGSHP